MKTIAEIRELDNKGGYRIAALILDHLESLTAANAALSARVAKLEGTPTASENIVEARYGAGNFSAEQCKKYGYDRVGLCGCTWSLSRHGYTCPEHGESSKEIPQTEPSANESGCSKHPAEPSPPADWVEKWIIADHFNNEIIRVGNRRMHIRCVASLRDDAVNELRSELRQLVAAETKAKDEEIAKWERDYKRDVSEAQGRANAFYSAILARMQPHFAADDRSLEWDVLPSTIGGLCKKIATLEADKAAQNSIDDLHKLLDLEASDDPCTRAFMVRCEVERMRNVCDRMRRTFETYSPTGAK